MQDLPWHVALRMCSFFVKLQVLRAEVTVQSGGQKNHLLKLSTLSELTKQLWASTFSSFSSFMQKKKRSGWSDQAASDHLWNSVTLRQCHDTFWVFLGPCGLVESCWCRHLHCCCHRCPGDPPPHSPNCTLLPMTWSDYATVAFFWDSAHFYFFLCKNSFYLQLQPYFLVESTRIMYDIHCPFQIHSVQQLRWKKTVEPTGFRKL